VCPTIYPFIVLGRMTLADGWSRGGAHALPKPPRFYPDLAWSAEVAVTAFYACMVIVDVFGPYTHTCETKREAEQDCELRTRHKASSLLALSGCHMHGGSVLPCLEHV
jgi:hypothetical protein